MVTTSCMITKGNSSSCVGPSKLDLYLAALALGLEFKALEIKSLVHGLGWELAQEWNV